MPQQIITTDNLLLVEPGQEQATITVEYNTVLPSNAPAAGLNFRLHYDSSQLEFDDISNLFDFGAQPPSFEGIAPQSDDNDLDGNADTDQFIAFLYADPDLFNDPNAPLDWPFGDENTDNLPISLFEANFDTTDLSGNTEVNFTLAQPQQGFDNPDNELLSTTTVTSDDPNLPRQLIVSELNTPVTEDNQEIEVTVSYDIDDFDPDITASGFNFRLHYDSDKLAFSEINNLFDFGAQPPGLEGIAPQSDDNDLDGNADTDQFIAFLYADPNLFNDPNAPLDWPFNEENTSPDDLPLDLFTINFETQTDFDSSALNFTLAAVQQGFEGVENESIGSLQIERTDNQPPEFVATAFAIDENTTAVPVEVEDPDGDDFTISLAGGADEGLFTIDGDGNLSFIDAPDFENPEDADGDNVYEVTVTAEDSNGGTTTEALEITVEDVNEAPVAENDTATTDEDTPLVVGTSPNDESVQQLDLSLQGNLEAGESFGVGIDYSTIPDRVDATGLNFAIAYDSSAVSVQDLDETATGIQIEDGFEFGLQGYSDQPDTDDIDNDPATDRVINSLYIDPATFGGAEGQWPWLDPNDEIPDGETTVNLGAIQFLLADGFDVGVDNTSIKAVIKDNPLPGNTRNTVLSELELPSGAVIVDGENLLANDSDPDEGDTLSITAVNGVVANVGSEFELNSGALLTVSADGSYVFDPNGAFESLGTGESEEVTFTYTVSDAEGLTDEATATITVEGVNDAPEFDEDEFIFDVDENSAVGTVVGEVTATDPDDEELTFEITGGNEDLDGDGEAAFTIDDDGQITVNDSDDLDFETREEFNLDVTVTDPDGLEDTATVNVELNDLEEGGILEPEDPEDLENNIFRVNGSEADPTELRHTLEGRSDGLVEVGLVLLDEGETTADALADGANLRSVFSILPNQFPNGEEGNFDDITGQLSRILSATSERVGYVLNEGNDRSIDKLIDDGDFTQLEVGGFNPIDLGNNRFTLESGDLRFTVEVADEFEVPLGAQGLQTRQSLEVYDFTQLTENDTVTANLSFDLISRAAFDNTIGFYTVDGGNGAIDGVNPGDEGYLDALLGNVVTDSSDGEEKDIILQGGGNIDETSAEDFEAQIQGGQIIVPFIISRSGNLDALPDSTDELPLRSEIYTPFIGANSDGADHFRLLADNTFGIEDLRGGGDQDFNDIIFELNFELG